MTAATIPFPAWPQTPRVQTALERYRESLAELQAALEAEREETP